jgi:hypothetical protein
VSIDRFTSAPMDGMLFGEEPLYKGSFELSFAVDVEGARKTLDRKAEVWGENVLVPSLATALRALRHALDDLAKGRLAVGGGSNRGHGYVRATMSDALSKALEDQALEAENAAKAGER